MTFQRNECMEIIILKFTEIKENKKGSLYIQCKKQVLELSTKKLLSRLDIVTEKLRKVV